MHITLGPVHGCALRADGIAECWGYQLEGRAPAARSPSNEPAHVLPTASFIAPASVATGEYFSLSLTNAQVSGQPQATAFTYAFDCGQSQEEADVANGYGAATGSAVSLPCVFSSPGAYAVRGKVIDQDGDSREYSAVVNAIGAAAQGLSFTSSPPNPASTGATYTVAASATSGLAVTFSSLTTQTCTVAGDVVSFVALGSCTIAANQNGNSSYLAAPQQTQSVDVSSPFNFRSGCGRKITGIAYDGVHYYVGEGHDGGTQCITRYLSTGPRVDTKQVGVDIRGLHFVPTTGKLTARAWSGPIYEIDYSTAAHQALSGGVVAPNNGQSQPAADPDGSTFWVLDFAGQKAERRRLSDGALVMTFAVIGGTLEAPAVAVSDLLVYVPEGTTVRGYEKATGDLVASYQMPTTTVGCQGYGFGASAAGDRLMYSASCGVAHVESIPAVQAQAITFTSAPPSPGFVGGNYAIGATGGSSGNPIVFSSSTSTVCTVSGNTVALIAAGTCTIRANQTGGNGFLAASQQTQSFAVSKGSQVVSFTSIPSNPAYGAVYAVSATGGGSGSPVVFSSLTSTVCTVSLTTVSFVGTGDCSVAANQAGTSSYDAAPQVTQTFTVSKAVQIITITTAPPGAAILGSSYTPAANSSSGLPVTFTTAGSCSFSGGAAQFGAVGTCIVTPHVSGNQNYFNADGPDQIFPIIYEFIGFFPNVSNPPAVNGEKAGATVRIKFSLGANQGLDVIGAAVSGDITDNCATTGTATNTVPAAAAAPFQYDATTGQYVYSWRTDASWVGRCRQFILTLTDGTVHRANFQFEPPDPTVTLTVTPAEVTAGVPATLTFALSVTSESSVTSVGGLPCTLPQVTGGVTYQGSCNIAQTWTTTGKSSYVAKATILGRTESFSSNTAAVSIVKPSAPVGLDLTSVSMGHSQACGITTSGAAYCWGYNANGQLGNGTATTASSTSPVAVSGGYTFASLNSGAAFTCGVTTVGAAYCWGWNGSGQLGSGTRTQSNVPVAVSGGHIFSEVSTGNGFTCGVTTNQAAYCWGTNGLGQLGNGTIASSNVPVAVSGGHAYTSVSVGDHHACGVTKSGTAYCWGFNSAGQLGNGTTVQSNVPVPVAGGHAFVSVIGGNQNSCGLTKSGSAYCWGSNFGGQLGNGTTVDSRIPVAVAGGHSFSSLSVGTIHACGVTKAGAGYCWGFNGLGQLGNSTLPQPQSAVPAPISGGYAFTSVTAGSFDSSCAVTKSGPAFCWGNNSAGQLGNGTTSGSSVPVLVVAPLTP